MIIILYLEYNNDSVSKYVTDLLSSVTECLCEEIVNVYGFAKKFRYVFYFNDNKYKFCLMIDSDTVNLTSLIRYNCNQVIRNKLSNKGFIEFSISMDIIGTSLITVDWYTEEFWKQFSQLDKVYYICTRSDF